MCAVWKSHTKTLLIQHLHYWFTPRGVVSLTPESSPRAEMGSKRPPGASGKRGGAIEAKQKGAESVRPKPVSVTT